MTNVTPIQQSMIDTRVYSPVIVRSPGLLTLLAQAVVGSFFGSFVLIVARILLVYEPNNGWFILFLPFLMVLGLATGVPAGLLIWAGGKVAHGPLHGINRSVLGVLVMSLAWFFVWLFWFGEDTPSDVQRWTLPMILAPGVTIGLITGSRLRPGRELVRGGEAKSPLPRILAGLVGLVLRVVVLFLFLASLLIVISILQFYYVETFPAPTQLARTMVWYILLFGHFALGVVILFARIRFSSLVILTFIAATLVVALFWFLPQTADVERYIVLGYLAAWAMFLLTRWRQTDVALSTIKEELRYYLID